MLLLSKSDCVRFCLEIGQFDLCCCGSLLRNLFGLKGSFRIQGFSHCSESLDV